MMKEPNEAEYLRIENLLLRQNLEDALSLNRTLSYYNEGLKRELEAQKSHLKLSYLIYIDLLSVKDSDGFIRSYGKAYHLLHNN